MPYEIISLGSTFGMMTYVENSTDVANINNKVKNTNYTTITEFLEYHAKEHTKNKDRTVPNAK
jgi:hypothetical protein